MHSELLRIFKESVDLDKQEEKLILKLFKPLTLRKGEFFLKSKNHNTCLGFLNKGMVRYYIEKKEKESTLEFTREGKFITEYQSFVKREKSIQNIQAIEDCEILAISYEDLQQISEASDKGNKISRLMVEFRYNNMVNHLLSVYMHTPEQRYKNFLDNYGDLCERIPQYLIASYVGIKPPSLCRIRKRMAKN